MRFNLTLSLLVIGSLLGCSDDSGDAQKDAAAKDAQVVVDTAPGSEATPGKDAAVDTAVDTTLVKDLAPQEGGAASCTPSADKCTGGLKCLCCGSIGPKPICICSSPCGSTADCKDPTQPACNKATDAGAGGICTPAGFNCCWFCK